jgi:hypothetical protein
MQESFGRDATAVKTRATDFVVLDHRHIEAKRDRTEGGRVTGIATTKDDQIERLGACHAATLLRLGRN